MSGHDVTSARVVVLDDGEAVAQKMAQWLLDQALAKTDGPFVMALSGGSTPKRLFKMMAEPDYASKFPWRRTHIFFGDDRHVAFTHDDSNYRMTDEILLEHIDLPTANMHPIPSEATTEEDAATYQATLQELYGSGTLREGKPLFDVVMLGMGPDGHTASLFPRQPILQERTKWVAACTPDNAPHDRVSLTYPAIHSSRSVVFLIEGAGKAEMLARVRSGEESLPASHITSEGEVVFLVDKAAAGEL